MDPDAHPTPPAPSAAPRGVADGSPYVLGDLRGDLPCARCRYNLRGLSITVACPECGMPVRATLLYTVDPQADELRRIYHPRLIARGLLAWSVGALLAMLCAWGVWFLALADGTMGWRWARRLPIDPAWGVWAMVVCAAVSGVGAWAIVRPQEGLRRSVCLLAALGCVLYLPLCAVVWVMFMKQSAWGVAIFANADMNAAKIALRIAASALMLAIVLGLRPNARTLWARSFVMRTGLVDRQTLAAIAAVLVLPLVADVVLLLAGMSEKPMVENVRFLAHIARILGYALLTLGLVGVVVDTVRLQGVILEAPLSLGSLLSARGEKRA